MSLPQISQPNLTAGHHTTSHDNDSDHHVICVKFQFEQIGQISCLFKGSVVDLTSL